MKRIKTLLILIFISTSIFAISNNNKDSDQSLGVGIGYNLYNLNQFDKQISLSGTNLSLYSNKAVKVFKFINTFLEVKLSSPIMNIKYLDDPNNITYETIESFNNQYSCDTILGLKLSKSISKNSIGYTSVGAHINILNYELDNTLWNNYSFGYFAGVGINRKLTTHIIVNLGFNAKNDILNICSSNSNDIEYNFNYLGFGMDANINFIYKF